MKLHLFHRAPAPGFNSIEEVFRALEPEFAKECEVVNVRVPRAGFTPTSLLTNIRYASRRVGQINHVTGHVHYLSLGIRKNVVLTVHDTRSSLRGSPYEVLLKKILLYKLPVRFVKRLTVVSEQTRTELQSLIGQEREIEVIPNPYSAQLAFKEKAFVTDKPTILHLGSTPNKNLGRTIRALTNIPCRLIIVGRPTSEELRILEEAGVEHEEHCDLSYSQIVALYERCDLVSFVSTYEGFGMPIIEGQVVGRPVVTSDRTPMREVSGGAAVLVDPDDVASIRAGFRRVMTSEDLRRELIALGARNAQRFRPSVIAASYLRIYREVLADSRVP